MSQKLTDASWLEGFIEVADSCVALRVAVDMEPDDVDHLRSIAAKLERPAVDATLHRFSPEKWGIDCVIEAKVLAEILGREPKPGMEVKVTINPA